MTADCTVSVRQLDIDNKFKEWLAALKRKLLSSSLTWGPRTFWIEIKCDICDTGDYKYSWCSIAINSI